MGGLAGSTAARNAGFRNEHGHFGDHGFHDRGRYYNRGYFGYGGFFPFAYYPSFYPDLYPAYLDAYYGPVDYHDYAPYYDSGPYYGGTMDDYGAATPYDLGPESVEVYPPTTAASGPADAGTDDAYYSQALAAFQRGDYQAASKLAAHAMIDTPRDVRVHELMSLAMFALGDYPGAAREAHAALILGPAIDWKTLYAYYSDLPAYTKQWDALKKYLADHPDSLDAQFLAAYHDLMQGHLPEAQGLLARVVAKVPQDKVAADLLKQVESGSAASRTPATPAPQPAP